ncbi:MAG: CcoQ/FixQ family Cbb3-type cytochrome c oxidase assembly chaperone [Robiginitalea sp.]|uniref:CcoQ/FixQ family Cbb3-type cytochrome c oxidase assembly chaperone n=1 Tax=Robiginitalea sp. TaxID=1902411 RepID=UPI003C77163C
MMKIVKHHMESIEGIATYPMISLLIFFVFFTVLFWWVFTTSKERIKELEEMPLDDQNQKPFDQ